MCKCALTSEDRQGLYLLPLISEKPKLVQTTAFPTENRNKLSGSNSVMCPHGGSITTLLETNCCCWGVWSLSSTISFDGCAPYFRFTRQRGDTGNWRTSYFVANVTTTHIFEDACWLVPIITRCLQVHWTWRHRHVTDYLFCNYD